MFARPFLISITLLFGFAVPLAAQQPDPNAEATALVRACIGLVADRKTGDAANEGRRAEARFRARLSRAPRDVEAMVGLARALSQCELPAAEMIAQGELSSQAIELLANALALDPTHWTARYVLASIHLRSPEFLGRAPRAAAEFDTLLQQQGARTDNPRFARVYEYRGSLYARSGKADSARILWTKGAQLFPSDSALAALARPASTPPTSQAPASLSTVRVVASAMPPMRASSTREIGKAQILNVAGGTADVLQSVQLQPGATRVGEGSDLYTRGGDPTETALLVDGGRVATLARFEGLNGGMFGAIEPFVVRAVRYSSGGFSVRNGNALSGVIDIETEGRPRERYLRAGLSLVQLAGTARLPLNRTSGLWMSARMSQTAALLATHGRRNEFEGAPHSEEAIVSYISAPSPTSEVRATALVEQDDARQITTAAQWTGPFHAAGSARSLLLSSRWLAPRAPLVVRANVTATDRTSAWDFGVLSRRRRDQQALARADAEWTVNESATVRAGSEGAMFARNERGAVPSSPTVAPQTPTRILDESRATTRQMGGYAELQLTRDATVATLGLRADALPGEPRTTIDPRINIATTLGRWTGRLATGVFHQGRWRAEPVIPDSLTPSGLAGRATHIVAGIERTSDKGSLQAELFDKRYADYARLGAGPEIAQSFARGVDLLASNRSGQRHNASLGYSFLHATMRLADGRTVRSPYDVTHSLTATLTSSLSSGWSLGETLRYGTGLPHTERASGARPLGARLPSYARADVRVMRYFRASSFLLTTLVEMINVTNRHNVSGITWDPAQQREVAMHSFFASRTVVAGGEFQFR